jgi:hypothetical protein
MNRTPPSTILGFFQNLWGTKPSLGLPRQPMGPNLAPGRSAGPDAITPSSSVYYDALNPSPNRTTIPSRAYDVAGLLSQYGYSDTLYREQLAGISRYLVDNYGMAWLAVSMIADYSVPVIPRAASPNPKWNKEADNFFDDWMERCDFHGMFDYETLQRLGCMAIDVDGDIGVVADGDAGFPQLRFVPGWKIGNRAFMSNPRDGRFEGVLLDDMERLLGYEVVYRQDRIQRYTRDQMILLFEPERVERLRGISAIRRGSNDIRDANDLKAFEKLAQKIDSAVPGVIEGNPNMTQADWEDPDNPSPSMAEQSRPSTLTLAQLFAGEIPVIEGGQWKQMTAQRDAGGKIELIDKLAGHFVAGCGLPPAFFLDEKMTGPGWRAAIGKAQRRFDQRKRVMKRLAAFSWVRVMADAIAAGQVPAQEGWQRRRYQMPSLITIDLGDQAQADREAVARGLKSRQKYHGAQADDWQDEEDQITAEDDYILAQLKEQSGRTGVPLEILLARRGFTQNGVIPGQNQGGNDKTNDKTKQDDKA